MHKFEIYSVLLYPLSLVVMLLQLSCICGAGQLIAVGVVDVLPRCLSSVYFFWDPGLQNLKVHLNFMDLLLHYSCRIC